MTADPARDQGRNLAELRAIAARLGISGLTPTEIAERLRVHPEALTFMARLRRSGLSDAAVAASLFDPVAHDGPHSETPPTA